MKSKLFNNQIKCNAYVTFQYFYITEKMFSLNSQEKNLKINLNI